MEVLISIFVLSIGLLGVAAVIPVAGFEILQAVKSDRAAACGQAVLEDMKVRGMLNPSTWRMVDPLDPTKLRSVGEINPLTQSGTYVSEHRGFLLGESYAIDPLYMALNQNPAADRYRFADFPYNPRTPGFPVMAGPLGVWTRLRRVTLSNVGLSTALAKSGFVWPDDLVIPVPEDDTERPRPLMVEDNAGNPLYGENAGHYTYLVTVTPSAENINFSLSSAHAYTYSENTPQYTVSVVVFYKRDTGAPSDLASDEAPGERQVSLKFLGGGLSGGDVELSLFDTDPPSRLPYLDLKENEWLMVSGTYPFWYDGGSLYPAGFIQIGIHKWYRVIAVGDIVVEDENGDGVLNRNEIDQNGNGKADPPYRGATLAGPDWNIAWLVDIDGDPLTPPVALATLATGAVGVYTKTVEFDW